MFTGSIWNNVRRANRRIEASGFHYAKPVLFLPSKETSQTLLKLFLLWTFHHPCRATISMPLKDHVAPHPHYFLLFSAHLLNISLFLLAASQQTALSNPEHFSFFLWPVLTDFIEPCKNIFSQQKNMTPSFLFIVPILSWAVWLSALNHNTLVVSVFREQLIVTQGSLWTESGEQGLIISKNTVAAALLRVRPPMEPSGRTQAASWESHTVYLVLPWH